MDGAEAFAWLLIIAIIFGAFMALSKQQQKLDDPDNLEVVFIGQLLGVCNLLGDGTFRLRIYRQSGSFYKDDQLFDSVEGAVKAAVISVKRAKIEYVVITVNTESTFSFKRPLHDHRGVNEGRKIGRVEILRIQ